jgi:hypothetical protein
MNDAHRLTVGIVGTATGWGLEAFAQGAAIIASLATALFMVVSCVQKIREMKK